MCNRNEDVSRFVSTIRSQIDKGTIREDKVSTAKVELVEGAYDGDKGLSEAADRCLEENGFLDD